MLSWMLLLSLGELFSSDSFIKDLVNFFISCFFLYYSKNCLYHVDDFDHNLIDQRFWMENLVSRFRIEGTGKKGNHRKVWYAVYDKKLQDNAVRLWSTDNTRSSLYYVSRLKGFCISCLKFLSIQVPTLFSSSFYSIFFIIQATL